MLFLNFFLFLVVVDYGVPIQLNLHLTEWIDNHYEVQHDCLLVNHWENQNEIYEITSYCMSEWPSKWNIEKNNFDKKFSFAELFQLNITSEQLYLWSAPLDLVENYQFYLNQVLISNEISTKIYWFYNCTLTTFGEMCQYSFDEDHVYYYSSLNKIIYDYYFRDKENQMNQTSCYIHLHCNIGLSSLCISWMNICDGVVQCINGTDEEYCGQLEITECNEDEFRCKNGQCIHSSFRRDGTDAPDCFDASDVSITPRNIISWNSTGPLYKLEEVLCLQWPGTRFPFGFGNIYGCSRDGINDRKELMFFVDKSNTISDICWSALNCYLKLVVLLNYFNCINICQGATCKEIIENECTDNMFFMPNVQIAYGHIYFAYTKQYIAKQKEWSNEPEYICYNERLCNGFYSNRTLIVFNNTVCRRLQDFPLKYIDPIEGVTFLRYYALNIRDYLYKCNTLLQNDSVFCDNSTMYQCINSSKCIAQSRLFDNRYDCNYDDDEIWNPIDSKCPIKSPRMYINCTVSKTCISRKLFNDGRCHCGEDIYDLCDDEVFFLNDIRLHISFPHICDNHTHLKPIPIDGKNETDETECEQWPCNNIYTRCNGIWNCFNGDDELDCHPSSLISCPSHSFACLSANSYDYICLSADKLNDDNIDCVGGIDETRLCLEARTLTDDSYRFFCRNSSFRCTSYVFLCDKRWHCQHGDDEKFCHQIGNPNLFSINGICANEYASMLSDLEEFQCNQFKSFNEKNVLYFSLGNRMKKPEKYIIKRNIDTALTSLSTNRIIPQNQHYCYYYPRLRVWLNKDKNETTMTCLCPPSHYGDRCQYQNQRVSLTIRFRSFSDSWETPFIVVVSLIDDSYERTFHSHEQLIYLPVSNCKTKYNIDFLYWIRSKNQSQNYSIHIDIYEKLTVTYRGSLLIPLLFSFLPVQRVAIQLNIPYTDYNFQNCSEHKCFHGRCIQYFDDPKYSTFCQCNSGWSGRDCTIPYNCTCASDSFCVGKLANNRSLCVCPVHKWGLRCLLHNNVCQGNGTCYNGGQCIPADRNVAFNKQFICICQKGFFGKRCERSQNKLILSFEKDMILPAQSMLVHFIEVKDKASLENGTTFKMIPIDRSPITIYWSHSFHIAFVEFIPQNYYLIIVKDINDQSNTSKTILKSSNRCPHLNDWNKTIAQFHLIRRIKYYHLACQQHAPLLSCFYDDVHLCLCTDFQNQRQANCFEFDSKLKRNCHGQSKCQNGAECLQDSVDCPETSICVCLPCFYGGLCQFSSSRFGLSLDSILGDYIQPHVAIRYQPVIIQISVTLTILITVLGLLNGILSIMTFMNKEPRKTGCGLYLMYSSITTLLISIIFCMKFWILLAAQMTYMTNQSFLIFQCYSIDFMLRTGLFMDQWLNACVAIERAFVTINGINFNKTRSKTIAKFVIPILFVFTIGTNIHEIIYRRLINDNSNDKKRIWCIVEHSPTIQLYNLIINILHFCAPFVINLLSAVIIIIQTARLRTTVKTEQKYRVVLFEQLQQHKHLLIAPIILVILAIPRLIISFVSGCMKSSADAWLFLMGYFISFIPPILTFCIFVIPSQTYKEEFYNTVQRYQRIIRAYFRLSN